MAKLSILTRCRFSSASVGIRTSDGSSADPPAHPLLRWARQANVWTIRMGTTTMETLLKSGTALVEGTRSGVSPIQLFPVRGNPVSPGKSSSLTAASNSDNAIVTIENRDNSSIFKHMIFSTLDALLSSSLPNRKKKKGLSRAYEALKKYSFEKAMKHNSSRVRR